MENKKLKVVDKNHKKLSEEIGDFVEKQENERKIRNQTFEIRLKTGSMGHEIQIYDYLGKLEYKKSEWCSKDLLLKELDDILTDKEKYIEEEKEFRFREMFADEHWDENYFYEEDEEDD